MSASVEDLKEAYRLGIENKHELTQAMLKQKGWSSEKMMAVLNALIQSRACVPRKNNSGQLVCHVREQDIVTRIKTLSREEYQVYCCIEEAGNVGIWTADMRKATNLQQHIIQKAIKNLSEVKRIIKQVKSIQHKNRKVYMLTNLQPSAELAGGCFYNNGEFDSALIEKLRDTISTVLRNGQQTNAEDIYNYVRAAGLGKDLTDGDLQQVLKTLQLEQKVIPITSASGQVSYTWARWLTDLEQISEIPCISCPVFDDCSRGSGGRVTPEKCEYLSYWMTVDEYESAPTELQSADYEEDS